ncbi:hypothetical protein ACLOJK_002806 [Asimina triloba]
MTRELLTVNDNDSGDDSRVQVVKAEAKYVGPGGPGHEARGLCAASVHPLSPVEKTVALIPHFLAVGV